MIYAFVALVVIVGWFIWAKKRGDAYLRDVADILGETLKDNDEPAGAIWTFLRSSEFKVICTSNFGSRSSEDTAMELFGVYTQNYQKWRSAGELNKNYAS